MNATEFKAYERFKEEAQFHRARTYDLEGELRVVRPRVDRADLKIDRLRQRVQKLTAENKLLKQRIADLTRQLKQMAVSM